jgi:hypothetical protein
MPTCLADSRDLNAALIGYDDALGPSIDHVMQLCDGGRDIESNMRAAHKMCNNAAGRVNNQVRVQGNDALRQTIGDLYPDLLWLAREIVRSD